MKTWLILGLALAAIPVAARVNLDFRPDAIEIDRGTEFDVRLFAVSDDSTNQAIGGLDVIVGWDPSVVQLLGFTNQGNGYNWLLSGFLYTDGPNSRIDDGDAIWSAIARFGNPAFSTPQGLLVTTFRFRATAASPLSLIPILPGEGDFITIVIDGFNAGRDVTGTLDPGARVTVRDTDRVRVVVNLTVGGLSGGSVTRQIDFAVGGNGSGQPTRVSKNVTFAGGQASVILDQSDGLEAGAMYSRISAKDPRHTLRSSAAISGSAGDFRAVLALTSGDATGDNVIDIIDYGAVATTFGQNIGGANTPIGFVNGFGGLHPDFNGDGLVTTADVTFVVNQFLTSGDPEPGGAARPARPRRKATVAEFALNGVRDAHRLDVDGDGWITVAEIDASMKR